MLPMANLRFQPNLLTFRIVAFDVPSSQIARKQHHVPLPPSQAGTINASKTPPPPPPLVPSPADRLREGFGARPVQLPPIVAAHPGGGNAKGFADRAVRQVKRRAPCKA